MSKASEDILNSLHGAIAQGLLDKIRSGEATAADYAAAIKFIKDNGIALAEPDSEPVINSLVDELPFDDGDTVVRFGR